MADEDYADFPTQEQLPVPAIAIDTYRHLWRCKWPYLGQLAIWTVLLWIVQKPTTLIAEMLDRMGFIFPVAGYNLAPLIIAEITKLLCLVVGGGLIFLSCGCAVFLGRKPRIGDVLRLPAVKGFWGAMFLFWLAAELIPVFAIEALFIGFGAAGMRPSWLPPMTWEVGLFVYPTVVWALIGLALPIAAFESAALPFGEAWRRLRGNHGDMLVLYFAAALPVIAALACFEYSRSYIIGLTMRVLPEVAWWGFVALLFPIRDFLSLLLFLVLAACTMHVYARLASDSDHVTEVFD
jgi:hypothetical protein